MDAHTVMEEWEVSPFDGGYKGLRERQSRRFSGAVEAGNSWLFFSAGEPLVVVDDLETDPRPGDIESFENATGQQHETTRPAAAKLAAMLALDGEVRGEYFTDETPLSRVHETLSEGGFTGYVELSENVLSGDYYVVYVDGAEAYLGLLGSSGRLTSGDEAQSKAEGEVGIYSVVAVSMPAVDVPQPSPDPSSGTAAAGDGTGVSASAGDATGPDQTGGESPEDADGSGPATGAVPDGPVDSAAGGATEPAPGSTAGETAQTGSTPAPTDGASGSQTADPAADSGPDIGRTGDRAPESESDARQPSRGAERGRGPGRSESRESERNGRQQENAADGRTPTADPSENVIDGVTTRVVPSLDPENSDLDVGGSAGGAAAEQGGRQQEQRPASRPDSSAQRPDSGRERPEGKEGTRQQHEQRPETSERRTDAVREEYERRIRELQSELEAVRDERDRLQRRVSSLEASEQPAGGEALSADAALDGTSLFIREGTQGGATLEDAYQGDTDRETLAANLRIEYHTQFDDQGATVDGEAFDDWLRGSTAYRFVEWLVTDLLFEIQSAQRVGAMRPLYDAVPDVDRIGFADTITVGDGTESREISFDVVCRNQMGDPLFTADISEGRESTYADGLEPVVTDATEVCGEAETLAAAFSVTESYFEPDALELAREATSGSLLGREKHPSFVKLSRKNGYHLCLVEAPEGAFHLSVPEL